MAFFLRYICANPLGARVPPSWPEETSETGYLEAEGLAADTGQKLAQVETGSAFACRSRYDKPGLVPSEHAKGDAIDIGSFVLADGRRIPVKQQNFDIPLSTHLVHALRMTACGYFTTVLGPGSDTAHEEHLHFDSGMHGATPNYRICE